jgi:hydroxymethylpyrimidine pyrophosphatase-like HAD family hydrolase
MKTQLEYYKPEVSRCGLWLFDLDNTCMTGNASAGIGKRYLEQELMKKNYGNVVIGLYGALWSRFYMMLGKEEKGKLAFINALNKAGCANFNTAYNFALETIKKHEAPNLKDVVKRLKELKKIPVVYTGGLDTSAKAAEELECFEYSFATHTFEGNKIVNSAYSPSGNKKEAAKNFLKQKFGAGLTDCVVVGDADTDEEVFKEAGLSIAAPSAKHRTIKAANLWFPSYHELYSQLTELDI